MSPTLPCYLNRLFDGDFFTSQSICETLCFNIKILLQLLLLLQNKKFLTELGYSSKF